MNSIFNSISSNVTIQQQVENLRIQFEVEPFPTVEQAIDKHDRGGTGIAENGPAKQVLSLATSLHGAHQNVKQNTETIHASNESSPSLSPVEVPESRKGVVPVA